MISWETKNVEKLQSPKFQFNLSRWVPCQQKVGIVCERERRFKLPAFRFPTSFVNNPFEAANKATEGNGEAVEASKSVVSNTTLEVEQFSPRVDQVSPKVDQVTPTENRFRPTPRLPEPPGG
jgi:hypothetical protein